MGGCEAKADPSTASGDEAMLDECWAGDVDDGVPQAILRSRTPSSYTPTIHLHHSTPLAAVTSAAMPVFKS